MKRIKSILFALLLCVATVGVAQEVAPGAFIDSIEIYVVDTDNLLVTVKHINELTDELLDKLNEENGMTSVFKSVYYVNDNGILKIFEGKIGRKPDSPPENLNRF